MSNEQVVSRLKAPKQKLEIKTCFPTLTTHSMRNEKSLFHQFTRLVKDVKDGKNQMMKHFGDSKRREVVKKGKKFELFHSL